ncbi:MAG: hypothetical protein KDA22_00695 [Phycisphaerales bacterium]|nr:hypothetical protein [Phycisphaerales bacterium]
MDPQSSNLLGALLGFGGALGTELAASAVSDSFRDRLASAPPAADFNHDIHGMLAASIERAIAYGLRERTDLSADDRALLTRLADSAHRNWFESVRHGLAEEGPASAMTEEDFISLFRSDQIESQPGPRVGTPEAWAALLTEYGHTDPPISDALKQTAGEMVVTYFAPAARDIARESFAAQDTGYPALVLRLLSGISGQLNHALWTIRDEHERTRAFATSTDFAGAAMRWAQGIEDRLSADMREALAPLTADLLSRISSLELVLTVKVAREHEKTRDLVTRLLAELRRLIGRQKGDERRRPLHNLAVMRKVANAAFRGREAELNDIARLIADHTAVAVVGNGGIGKTELARHFVNTRATSVGPDQDASREGTWNHIWWIDGSIDGEFDCLVGSARTYELITGKAPPTPVSSPPSPEWLQAVRSDIAQACSDDHKHLIVLDNAESADQVRAYTPAAPSCMLVTTRRTRMPAGMQRLDLDPCSKADARDILVGEHDEQGAFLQRDEHEQVLGDIAQHLGYHALGLAYAAAALRYLPRWTPTVVLANIRATDIHFLDQLHDEAINATHGKGLAQTLGLLLAELDVPGAPRSHALAVELAELTAFCAASPISTDLFYGFSGAAEDDVDAALAALRDRSIIKLNSDHVTVHRLTQWVVRSRLRTKDPTRVVTTLERCLDYMESELARGDDPQTLVRRANATGHLRANLDELYRYGSAHREESHRVRHLKVRAHRAVAMFDSIHGLPEDALRHAEAGLALLSNDSDTFEWACLHVAQGCALAELVRDTEALQDFELAVRWGEANRGVAGHNLDYWYYYIAESHAALGNVEEAMRALGRARASNDRRRDTDPKYQSLFLKCEAETKQHTSPADAEEAVRRAITLEDQRGASRDPRRMSILLSLRASLLLELNPSDEESLVLARSLAEDAVKLAESHVWRDVACEIRVRGVCIRVMQAQRHVDAATHMSEQSLRRVLDNGMVGNHVIAETLIAHADLLLATSVRQDEARELYITAMQHLRAGVYRADVALADALVSFVEAFGAETTEACTELIDQIDEIMHRFEARGSRATWVIARLRATRAQLVWWCVREQRGHQSDDVHNGAADIAFAIKVAEAARDGHAPTEGYLLQGCFLAERGLRRFALDDIRKVIALEEAQEEPRSRLLAEAYEELACLLAEDVEEIRMAAEAVEQATRHYRDAYDDGEEGTRAQWLQAALTHEEYANVALQRGDLGIAAAAIRLAMECYSEGLGAKSECTRRARRLEAALSDRRVDEGA